MRPVSPGAPTRQGAGAAADTRLLARRALPWHGMRGCSKSVCDPWLGWEGRGSGVLAAARGTSPGASCLQVAEEEEVAKKPEKLNFTVKLVSLKAEDKVKLIKEVKNHKEGLNLVQAKKLVESLPQEIKANVSKAEAEKIKAALEAVGGTVVLE
ncbi:39S ribosomal protein L12, mitochondrial [Alligator sinensis]|uniref:39S ribosomal protein L12, mitochondrial n=1 Tax=Alligator sinensis TaxID=38654 RepID=A0A1U7SJP2_ALLSI|nr:39S ribosomal protein L12, mitochondrial [Alligator sinensis]